MGCPACTCGGGALLGGVPGVFTSGVATTSVPSSVTTNAAISMPVPHTPMNPLGAPGVVSLVVPTLGGVAPSVVGAPTTSVAGVASAAGASAPPRPSEPITTMAMVTATRTGLDAVMAAAANQTMGNQVATTAGVAPPQLIMGGVFVSTTVPTVPSTSPLLPHMPQATSTARPSIVASGGG